MRRWHQFLLFMYPIIKYRILLSLSIVSHQCPISILSVMYYIKYKHEKLSTLPIYINKYGIEHVSSLPDSSSTLLVTHKGAWSFCLPWIAENWPQLCSCVKTFRTCLFDVHQLSKYRKKFLKSTDLQCSLAH